MVSLLTLLVVILSSLIVTRIATKILTLTGLSSESARFQARSALTGVGFTTSEAEAVVNHPVRRRVVMALMLVGSAGVITVIATLMLSFIGAGDRQTATRAIVLLAGLVAIFLVARSALIDRLLSRLIERALTRWTTLDIRDYASLLHLAGEYTVTEIFARADGWVAGRKLEQLDLREEGVRVLGIVRGSGEYVGAPIGSTRVNVGDTVVVYGRRSDVARVADRPRGRAGDEDHRAAVLAHRELVEAEAGGRHAMSADR